MIFLSFHRPIAAMTMSLRRTPILALILVGLVLCFCMPAAVAQTNGTSLMKQAAALERAHKYQEAGAAYDKAAKAFATEGKSGEQTAALQKSAEMYEKLADEQIKGGAPATAPATPPVSAPPAPVRTAPPASLPGVGGKVEAYSHSEARWLEGTITEIETNGQHKGPYHVVFSDKKLVFPEDWLPAVDIRPAGLYTGRYKVGDRVDDFYPGGMGNGSVDLERGKVIAVDGFRYKIHYDGCKAYWDKWVDGSLLLPAATIPAGHPDVRYLIGSWAMFQPGAPNTVVHDGKVYREYGFGAKAPPLQINADGTYVWKVDFDKPAVRGRWTTSAMIPITNVKPGQKITPMGAHLRNGIVIQDAEGGLWKVYKEVYAGKKADSITLRKLCEGLELMGTRVK